MLRSFVEPFACPPRRCNAAIDVPRRARIARLLLLRDVGVNARVKFWEAQLVTEVERRITKSSDRRSFVD